MTYLAVILISFIFFSTLLFGLSFILRSKKSGLNAKLLGFYFLCWCIYVSSNFLLLEDLLDYPKVSVFTYQAIWFLSPVLFSYHQFNLGKLTRKSAFLSFAIAGTFALISIFLEIGNSSPFEITSLWIYFFYSIGFFSQFILGLAITRSLIKIDLNWTKSKSIKNWHLILYGGFAALMFLRTINLALGYFIENSDLYFATFAIVATIVTLYIALLILYSFSHSKPLDPNNLTIRLEAQSEIQAYSATYQAILNKVTHYMEDQKAYTDSELTLKKLADELELKAYLISKSINNLTGKSFSDFVNTYRVESAIDLLDQNLTVQQVMHASGFNSKTPFHKAFKKIVGQTPNEYRKTESV